MATHKVMPPVQLPAGTTGIETIEMLQRRLQKTDHDTQHLVKQLAQMGFSECSQKGKEMRKNNVSSTPESSTVSGNASASIAPFSPGLADPDVLHKNYESLVSRVCKAESTIQSLKLNLLRAQAERSLGEKECQATNAKLSVATDAYEKELKRLHRELMQEKRDCKNAQEAKKEISENFRKVQKNLEEAITAKAEKQGELEDCTSTKQKLTRRVDTLREELSRESQLRGSLEESHNTLLSRVKDMEQVVEQERNEVKTLTGNCSQFKQETLRATEDLARECHLRSTLEEDYNRLSQERERLSNEAATLRGDKDLLMKEVQHMQLQYQHLNQHLDQVQKVTQDRQSTHEQLETENKQLFERVKTATGHNATIVADYESRLEDLRAELSQARQEADKNAHLQELLMLQSTEKTCALQECANLNEKVDELKHQLANKKNELNALSSSHEKEISQLAERVHLLEDDKSKAMKDKDILLDEVNQAVDSMTEEKARLEAEQESTQLEIIGLQQANHQLEAEHRRLIDKIANLEDHQGTQQQVQNTLAELTSTKQKLAYDKGRLEGTVEQLQKELEALATSKGQCSVLQKQNMALQTKCSQLQSEVTNQKLQMQRVEGQLKQASMAGERKETDFDLAIRSRDEALNETKSILSKMKSNEQEYTVKVRHLEESLSDSRADNLKLASTLESIMSTHATLQHTVETLQAELGKKDSCLATLQRDKRELQDQIGQLQGDLGDLGSKLAAVTDMETKELKPLRQALSQCKKDNSKMAASMESLLKTNTDLQNSVKELQDKLEQKSHVVERLNKAKNQTKDHYQQQLATAQTRLQQERDLVRKEREKIVNKTSKDLSKVQKQLEDALSKNGDLSRTNSDLRSKVTEQEYQLKEQKDKVIGLKNQNNHLSRVRQKHEETIESLQKVNNSLEELEKTKNEYTRKNKEQAKTIQSFVLQMAGLQSEVQELARLQTEAAEDLHVQEQDMSLEQKQILFKAAKKKEGELESRRKRTEQRMLQVNEETHNLSSTIQDTHQWFQSKFDALQDELSRSRVAMTALGEGGEERVEREKRRSEDVAARARAMIRTSHETVSKLADYADMSQKTKHQELSALRSQLEEERKKARLMEDRLHHVQESSMRHTEQLAREVHLLKSQSSLYEDQRSQSINYSDISS